MDRLIAYWAWRDMQSWDQAVLVCQHNRDVDQARLRQFALEEGEDPKEIDKLLSAAKPTD